MFHGMLYCAFGCLILAVKSASVESSPSAYNVDVQKTRVWGPGLKVDFFLPVRYFYIQAVSTDGNNITWSIGNPGFSVTLTSLLKSRVRVYMDILDRKDGLYIVRFRLVETENDLKLSVTYKGEHVADSPYALPGPVYPENCYCPEQNPKKWLGFMECPYSFQQIENDLAPFKEVDLEKTSREVRMRYNVTTAHGLCHYKIIDNKIYSKAYGDHVQFKGIMDATMKSITRKVWLPDLEFFINLGDWHGMLEEKGPIRDPVPIFSWCGSDESYDIVMPTFDLTKSTLEMLESDGSTSLGFFWFSKNLDVFSVMGYSSTAWENKKEIGFWRGRDSCQDRLDFVVMFRKHSELVDAKMNRMLIFEHDEAKYGAIVDNVQFHDFFKYKYQINVDGAVAAYRLPYLLAGDSVVLKQDSHYYEHFYKELKPHVHYIPFKSDFNDLLEKIQWLKDNDEKAKEISRNGRNYIFDRLTPKHIYCYHVKLFLEYSKRVKSPPTPPDGSWEFVGQSESQTTCLCNKKVENSQKQKEEL